jgi:transposase
MSGTLHLAQALSNRGARGRKKDFPDAERLVKRLVAQELTLSFVPDVEQRLWRTVMRRKYQVTRNRVQRQNRLECLLEEAHIKVSSLVSDLLGASARRMLQALADGETNPETLAGLASRRLRATPDQLCDALGACTDLHPVYRRLLTLTLEELRVIDDHIAQLDREMASLLSRHQPAVQRLAEVPGLGVDSAQQIIAEVGPAAATFPSPKHLASWVGACPGDEESAGVNYSHRSPNGNRQMRRVLNQAANAAVKTKGSIFELVYRRLGCGESDHVPTSAHKVLRLIGPSRSSQRLAAFIFAVSFYLGGRRCGQPSGRTMGGPWRIQCSASRVRSHAMSHRRNRSASGNRSDSSRPSGYVATATYSAVSLS